MEDWDEDGEQEEYDRIVGKERRGQGTGEKVYGWRRLKKGKI